MLDPEHHVAAAVSRARAEQARDAVFGAVAALRNAVLGVSGEALEVVLEDEVDHAADRVGAVGRRGTAGDDLDALDGRRWDGVDVDHAGAVDRSSAAPVHQHQVAVGAELAEADRGCARGVGGRRVDIAAAFGRAELGQRRRQLRQLVEVGLEVDRARLLEQCSVDRNDRAGRGVVAPRDARARHQDRVAA
jgi:hypothetical protein